MVSNWLVGWVEKKVADSVVTKAADWVGLKAAGRVACWVLQLAVW